MTDRAGAPAPAAPPPARPGLWLSVAEAANATGWHPDRLRSLGRRGTITSRRGNRGLEILVEEGRPRSVDGRPLPEARARGGVSGQRRAGGEAAQRQHAQQLEATTGQLRDELAAAGREIGALKVELARAEERGGAVEAVARGDVEAAKRVVEAEIAAKDEVDCRAAPAGGARGGPRRGARGGADPSTAAVVASVAGLTLSRAGGRHRRRTAKP